MTILVVNEYLTAFDAANNNVVQGAGRVNTGLSGHDRKAINLVLNSQVYMLRALYIKIIKEYTGTGSIEKINYRVPISRPHLPVFLSNFELEWERNKKEKKGAR